MKLTKAVVPSVFTVMNLICGYLSILLVVNGKLLAASYLILLAIFFDVLDGKIARKLNQPSRFGLEFDSLADITSFGVAPSVLIYNAFSGDWVVSGALVAFLPLLFTGIRLAKFNVHSERHKRQFIGLPAPSMAAVLAGFVLFNLEISYDIGTAKFVLPLILSTAILMVSTMPFNKFPNFSMKKEGKYNILLFVFVFSITLMFIYRGLVIFPISFIYVLYSFVHWVFHMSKGDESEMADSAIGD